MTQRLRDGSIAVLEVPAPELTPDGVLVDVRASLLSAGTERSKVETGRQSLVAKARSRPDQVRQVVEKAQKDGLKDTVRTVRRRLEQPSTLGYSAAGVALAVGARVRDIVPGDRVACGGADYAVHAEIDHVPANLCVPLPSAVSFDHGAFATVGSIAMHGARQADVRLGEKVAVIGLGLVGQLAGQLLRASGCHVVGIDLSLPLLQLAREHGAADVTVARSDLSGRDLPPAVTDCDAVVITAATKSSDPIELAAQLCRDRGRVVVVGDVGMEMPRAPYYGKELELRLSRSYGPGRYDREYEERGLDYPVGYVRWTERRNMASFVELAASGLLDLEPLISDRLPVERAPEAYERLLEKGFSPLGLVLQSEASERPAPPPRVAVPKVLEGAHARSAGLIGAGSFAQGTIVPALQAAGFGLTAVASATGRTAEAARVQFGFGRTSAVDELVTAPDVGLVVIATRHTTHAPLALAALDAGKAVFVEKPPALTVEDVDALEAAVGRTGLPFAVGFNRRHAPRAEAMRDHVRGRGPMELIFRVNAGPLPVEHWLNDLDDGGGRLLGEGCHFIDFACWMVGGLPERVSTLMRPAPGEPLAAAQRFTAVLEFADGSLATVVYGAGGAGKLGKELVEAHAGGRSAVLDDFASLVLFDGRRKKTENERRRDKGHKRQFECLRAQIAGSYEPAAPGPLETMRVTLAALRSAETGRTVRPGGEPAPLVVETRSSEEPARSPAPNSGTQIS